MSLGEMAKRVMCDLMYRLGMDILYRNRTQRRLGNPVCILSAHRVIDEQANLRPEDIRDLRRGCLSVSTFRRAIDCLRKRYRVEALGVVVDAVIKGEGLPPRCVVLTFDDAYNDVARHAYPLLAERKVPFTVFQTSSYLDTHAEMLDREDLQRLRDDPLVTWGAHGVTHGVLTKMSDAKLRHEIQESKRVLEDVVEKPVEYFCYPDGKCDDRVVAEVRDAGYRGACVTGRRLNYGSIDPFSLHRVPFVEEPSSRFAFRVAGRV